MKKENENNFEAIKKSEKYKTIRVSRRLWERLERIISKANNKSYGRKVFPSKLIEKLLNFVDDGLIHELQQETLRTFEKFDLQYCSYIQKYGFISREEYDEKCMELFSNRLLENRDGSFA